MTTWNRKVVVGLAATALTVTLGGCNQGGSGDAGGGDGTMPLQIGVVAPLTGPTAIAGRSQACGALVAADAINAVASDPGQRVEIHLEDSKGDPAEAARAAGKLTAKGITFFGGGLTTSEVAAELPIYADAEAITTAGTSQAQSILHSGAMVARLQPDTAVAGEFVAEFLANQFNASSVAMLTQDIEYSQELAQSVMDSLDDSIKVHSQSVPFDEVTFASVIDALLASDPDAFFLPIAGFDKQVAFIREYARTGTDVPLVLGPSILNTSLVESAGDDANGVYGFDTWNASVDNEASTTMVANFEKYAGDHAECVDATVSTQALLEYSSVMLYHKAAAMAGTRHAAEVYATILGNTWDLPQGSLTFSENGQAQAPQIVVRVEGGEVVTVK